MFTIFILFQNVLTIYRVTFFHKDKNCKETQRVITAFGTNIKRDFPLTEKCRYYESYKPEGDGSRLYRLAFSLRCQDDGTVRLIDYHPKLNQAGCMIAEELYPPSDEAYAFTRNFTTTDNCQDAPSPDGDPSGESWKVEWDEDACKSYEILKEEKLEEHQFEM